MIDLTGQRFGRLTVLERDKSTESSNRTLWKCVCDCGTMKSVSSHALRYGLTKSCGCLSREIASRQKDLSHMIGKRFGNLTIINRDKNHITPSGQSKVRWVCLCDCGKETTVNFSELKSGHTKSCGCMTKRPKGSGLIDLTGRRFGKLVVVERAEDYVYRTGSKITTLPRWLCRCDCGNDVVVQGGNLRSGVTTSCGCQNRSSRGERYISEFLTEHCVKFLREYSFDDLRNRHGNLLRFDFAILGDNDDIVMLVEYQGAQHYIDCGLFGLYQRQYSDAMKRDYCEAKQIKLYEIRYDDDLNSSLNVMLEEINKRK